MSDPCHGVKLSILTCIEVSCQANTYQQTERQTDRQADRQADGKRETDTKKNIHLYKMT